MSRKLRVLLLGALSAGALVAVAGGASAATGVDVRAGTFTAITSGLQTMGITFNGTTAWTIWCTQTIVFRLTGGLVTGAGLQTIGSVTSFSARCPTPLGDPRVIPLGLPWPIGAEVSRFSRSTTLVEILGVRFAWDLFVWVPLFTGSILWSLGNGSATAQLLSMTYAVAPGSPFSNLRTSSASYSLSSPFNYTTLG